MYAMGMSTRAMRNYVQAMYAMDNSAAEISRIINSVLPAVQEWRNRPLEAVYPCVFLDWMLFKVGVNGAVETRAIYNIVGVDVLKANMMFFACIQLKMKVPKNTP